MDQQCECYTVIVIAPGKTFLLDLPYLSTNYDGEAAVLQDSKDSICLNAYTTLL